MPNRIIKESICTSSDIDSLGDRGEVFFYRLWVNCDDYGRFDARANVLKSRLYPLRDRMKLSEIDELLARCVAAGLVFAYNCNGKAILQVTGWDKHQQIRNKRSKYEAYDEKCTLISFDIKRYHRKADAPVIQSNTIQSESESEYKGETGTGEGDEVVDDVGADIDGLFRRFWDAYPRKVKKAVAAEAFKKVLKGQSHRSASGLIGFVDQMIKAIGDQKKTAQWVEDGGKYIPYPASWLNGGQWEDCTKIEVGGISGTGASYDMDEIKYRMAHEVLIVTPHKRKNETDEQFAARLKKFNEREDNE